MRYLEVVQALGANLAGLGARRLSALALAGVTVFMLVGVSSYLMTRPEYEVLYSDLQAADAAAIGAALAEAGIAFDVNAAGDAVEVGRGQAAKARMYLAQRGLPRGGSSGYELFDQLGSLGLTSFMQQITKVRAIEGELSRSIQLIDGIRAARVHISLGTAEGFRGSRDKPTASVIVRGDSEAIAGSNRAIRHLVAAAIPGLSADQVIIMGTDGALLASVGDGDDPAPERLMVLEQRVASQIEENVGRALLPALGPGNLRVSVTAKLNADRHKVSETKYDPESRVERSVRTFKESGEAENATGADGVSVDQNVPREPDAPASNDSSREKNDRKEELTNYEINSKSIETESDGYGIERLSVAVVINRQQIVKLLGDGATEEAIAREIDVITRIVRSAGGLDTERGDQLEVSPVDFSSQDAELMAAPEEGFLGSLGDHLGALIKAVGLIAVTFIVVLFGLRPALRQLLPDGGRQGDQALAGVFDSVGPVLPMNMPSMEQIASGHGSDGAQDSEFDDLQREVSRSPRDRLAKIVELDPERAAEVLRQWLSEPAEGRP